MTAAEAEELFSKGIAAVDKGDTVFGMVCLEKLFAYGESPLLSSYFAVCLAREREEFGRAYALLSGAQRVEPAEPVHYLNLGRVHLACGEKRQAIKVFRDGLLFRDDPRIRQELNRIGWRNPRVFSRLSREHFLNRYLGIIGSKLGFR
jgi:hypothetical protein